jgi:hypothetical protein
MRQLALQQDAARTLGKNAATFKSAPTTSSADVAGVQGSAEASSDDFYTSVAGTSQAKTGDAEGDKSAAEESAEAPGDKVEEAPVLEEETRPMAQVAEEESRPKAQSSPPPPPPPAPVVNYREAWREAANRNLFSILSNSRKARASATVSRVSDDASREPPAPTPPLQTAGQASEESRGSQSEDAEESALEALPILEQYVAAPAPPRRQEAAEKQVAQDIPELEVVGEQVVGAKAQEQKTMSRDVWKVIAPNGVVVHAGPGDDFKPLGRLRAFQLVEVDEQRGVWLKLAQAVGSDDGWVRKEEGRGKRGGGLARKDAALMVKQGKVLGFDSEAMSKWKVNSN